MPVPAWHGVQSVAAGSTVVDPSFPSQRPPEGEATKNHHESSVAAVIGTARRAGQRLQVIAIAIILVVTMLPTDPSRELPLSCLICGEHGTADALRNVLLFVPLGVGMRLAGMSIIRCFLLATLLSVLIELAQLGLPGRHASAGDVLFNGIGGAVGAIAVAVARRRSVSGLVPGIGATICALAVWIATAYLLEPQLPDPPYYGQWTPRLAPDQWYAGRVLDASIGTAAIDSARSVRVEGVRRLWAGGPPFRVRAIVGPPPTGWVVPLVRIHDASDRVAIQQGFQCDDFVLRHGTRASAVRLDQPDLRTASPPDMAPGDTIEFVVRRHRDGFSIAIGDTTLRHLGYTLGQGWALVVHLETVPSWVRAGLNACWIAAWVFIAGLCMPSRAATAASAGVLLAGLVLIPYASSLVATPPLELGAAAAGLGAALLVNAARRQQRQAP